MNPTRPELNNLPADVVAYIQALEQRIDRLEAEAGADARTVERRTPPTEPDEAPTTMQIVTISAGGLAKRTPRHLYSRQRRGGMGVFDLESDDDPPAHLVHVDQAAGLLLITNQARAFRIPVQQIPQTEVRGRGDNLLGPLPLRPDETLAVVAADQGSAQLMLVSLRGQVRRIAGQYLGKNLQPGTVLYDPKEGGPPAACCWASGADDLVIVTRSGRGIRFAERQVPLRGCLGLRVDPDDRVVGVASVAEQGGFFVLTDDGKGTIRLMSGFSANKAPGAGGKVVIKSDQVTGIATVDPAADGVDDLFVISSLGKIIRFRANEVPPKEGVVQGVNCMTLRADSCTAIVAAHAP